MTGRPSTARDIDPASLVEALRGTALVPRAGAIVGGGRGPPIVPDVAAEAVSELLCYGLVCRVVVHGQSFQFVTNICSG
jgi:hypothetical protein